jgi:hypothetical protein
MITSLLTLKLRGRRDLVLARWRARQIAGLLGFEFQEQAGIAAAVFEIAQQSYKRRVGVLIRFQLKEELLQVFAVGGRPRQPAGRPPGDRDPCGIRRFLDWLGGGPTAGTPAWLTRPVPKKALAPAREDLPWLVEVLARHTPLDLFAEIQKQNQELVRALQAVKTPASDSAAATLGSASPAA